jgi:hypothetical protein
MYGVICIFNLFFIFLCRLEINHTKTDGEYAGTLENGAVAKNAY